MNLRYPQVVLNRSSVVKVIPSSEVIDWYIWEFVVEPFKVVPILFLVVIIVLVLYPVGIPLLSHRNFRKDFDVF